MVNLRVIGLRKVEGVGAGGEVGCSVYFMLKIRFGKRFWNFRFEVLSRWCIGVFVAGLFRRLGFISLLIGYVYSGFFLFVSCRFVEGGILVIWFSVVKIRKVFIVFLVGEL